MNKTPQEVAKSVSAIFDQLQDLIYDAVEKSVEHDRKSKVVLNVEIVHDKEDNRLLIIRGHCKQTTPAEPRVDRVATTEPEELMVIRVDEVPGQMRIGDVEEDD